MNGFSKLNLMSFLALVRFIVLILFISVSAKAYDAKDVVPNEIIVKFKETSSSFAVQGKVAAQFQLQNHRSWKGLNINHFKTKPGENLEAILHDLKRDPNVEFAEPNFYVYASNLPYAMTSTPVRIRESWAILPNPGAIEDLPIVAIIDSGLDLTHPIYNQTDRVYQNLDEIAGNGIDDDRNGYIDDVSGWNFISNSSNIADDTGHGTHVSGIVLGSTENIFEFRASSSPRVQILPLKFLNESGVGKTSDAINAINYAINRGAKVINNSWGGGSYSSTLHSALTTAYNNGIVIVAAAGNSSSNNDSAPIYPSSLDLPSMISVASTSSNRNWSNVNDGGVDQCRSSFSNFGPNSVDVFAPGNAIYSTYPMRFAVNGFDTSTGTSMASPFVAGLAAMIALVAPNLSGYQIKQILLESADYNAACDIYIKTGRRINFENAVALAFEHQLDPNSQPNYTPLYTQGNRSLASSDPVSSGLGCGRVADFYQDHNNQFLQTKPEMQLNQRKFNISSILLFIPVLLLLGLKQRMAKNDKRKNERKTVNMQGQMILDNGWILPVLVKNISTTGAGLQLLGDALNYNYSSSSGTLILNLIFGNGETLRYKAQVVRSDQTGFVGIKFKNS